MFAIRYLGSDNFSFRRILRYFLIFLPKCLERWKTNFWYNLKKKLDLPIVFVQKHIIWRKTPLDRKGGSIPKVKCPVPYSFLSHSPTYYFSEISERGNLIFVFRNKNSRYKYDFSEDYFAIFSSITCQMAAVSW